MTDNDFEELQPVDIPLTQTSASQQPTDPVFWYQKKSTVIALGLALVLVVGVIFLLPQYISPVATPPVSVAVVDTTTPVESPFQQQQANKARREAQDILNKLLEKQQYLENRQVSNWAGADFQQALTLAEKGDGEYRQRQYSQAIADYQQADNQLQQLMDSIPTRLETLLQQGSQAINNAKPDQALQQFELALVLDPENQIATLGKQRSQNLPQVLSLMEQAQLAQQQGQLTEALALFRDAKKLDPAYIQASKAIDLLTEKISQNNFLQAMSQGYDALEDGNYQAAKKFFTQATQINPNDEAANNALNQASNKLALDWLNNNLAQAAKFESQEKWQQAAQTYQQILARDDSIIDAKIGKLRTEARAKLDSTIDNFLQHPERLATPAVLDAASHTLAEARKMANPGPRLTQQINQLQTTINTAAKPLPVALVSDNQTKVTVYKIGELGQFNSKNLSLRPGHYVAVGSRKGYRDVRVEFEVQPGNQNIVQVICEEPIS